MCGLLEEAHRVGVVVTRAAVAQDETTDGIGRGDASKNRVRAGDLVLGGTVRGSSSAVER
jgi:hypothetical protein